MLVSGKYRKVPNKREDNWVWSPQGMIDMHRPEKWGYVQFSTRQPNGVEFKPDPTGVVRDMLLEIYYTQREFRQRRKVWASSLDLLGLTAPKLERLLATPTLKITDDGYQASAALRLPSGETQTWHITQDARLWSDD